MWNGFLSGIDRLFLGLLCIERQVPGPIREAGFSTGWAPIKDGGYT